MSEETHPGDEELVVDVPDFEDIGTDNPFANDEDDGPEVFEPDTDIDELPDPDTKIEPEDPRDG